MDQNKETGKCQGTAGWVVLVSRLIMAGLWECQMWTKQEGAAVLPGEEGPGGEKARSGIASGRSEEQWEPELEQSQWECVVRDGLWNVSVDPSGRVVGMRLSLRVKRTVLGNLSAEEWIMGHSATGDRPVLQTDILQTGEDLCTWGIYAKKGLTDLHPKRVAGTQSKVKVAASRAKEDTKPATQEPRWDVKQASEIDSCYRYTLGQTLKGLQWPRVFLSAYLQKLPLFCTRQFLAWINVKPVLAELWVSYPQILGIWVF